MYDNLVMRLRAEAECPDNFPEDSVIMRDAADAIEDLEKQLSEEKVDNVNLTGWLAEEHAKHLWIPVTEKENLPNTDSGVVGYFGGGAFDQLRWYDFVSTLSDGSIVSENSERDVQNEHCIAVFKLPEPPKEET